MSVVPGSTSRSLAALGAYFAAEFHERAGEPRAPWRSMGELLDEPGLVDERVAAVRGFLAAASGGEADSVELRVAASVMHLGLAARTLSPVFGLAVLGHAPATGPGPSLRELWWQPAVGSMFQLSIPGPAEPSVSTPTRVDVSPLALELCEIMRPFGVSTHVLRGNIASALNGARVALSSAEPRLASVAWSVLGEALEGELLTGTADASSGGRFRRRSCCLIYRAAPDRRGAVCGDCVLVRR